MVFGQTLVEEFDDGARQGVIGHELGHLKWRHLIIKATLLGMAICAILFYFTQLPFPIYMDWLISFAAIGLVIPTVSWPLEFWLALFFLLHVLINIRLAITSRHPLRALLTNGVLIIIGRCILGIVVYMEYFRPGG